MKFYNTLGDEEIETIIRKLIVMKASQIMIIINILILMVFLYLYGISIFYNYLMEKNNLIFYLLSQV